MTSFRIFSSFTACFLLAFTLPLKGQTPGAFSDFYELEPFQVVGNEIPITIFARNSSDRRYATRFTHDVVEVVYQTIERSPGSGLVIIGRPKEPHPLTVLNTFLEMSKSAEEGSELRRLGEELEANLESWRSKIDIKITDDDEEVPFDTQALIDAFPIPLNGIAADLYLMAWEAEFDIAKFEQRIASVDAAQLSNSQFREFNWVFYLPPRNSTNLVIKELLPAVFEAEEIGPFKRILIRGMVATFKPLIKDAVESIRRGVLYWSVLESSGAYTADDRKALTEAYFGSQMPRGKIIGGDKKKRGIEAVEEQKAANEAYAKDPFVLPEPLAEYDAESYRKFAGDYGAKDHRMKRFIVKDGSIFWQEGDDEPVEYFPASETFFVSSEKDITIRFLPDEFGQFTQVDLRKGRMRWTFQRFPDVELNL